MRIAQVAPLYESVPPRLYGGTERVVSWLADELVQRGHEVTLFASGDSRTQARLVSAWPRAVRLDPAQPDPFALHTLELAQAFSRADDFDVVHCHVDYLAFPYGRLVSTPVVHTLHGRLDLRPLIHVLTELREVPLVSISESQREPLAGLDLNWVATVHHGLPMRDVPAVTTASDGRYLVFLGRMSAEKRPDLAIAVAKRAGLPLIMAAKVDRPDREYFEREIRPQLGHPLIEWLGEQTDRQKAGLLADAAGLLVPISWEEPFGLVFIEALASGTPVISRPRGSVPELLRDGEHGFLVESEDEMVDACRNLDTIDRRACRDWALQRFSVERMTTDYLRVYRKIIDAARESAA